MATTSSKRKALQQPVKVNPVWEFIALDFPKEFPSQEIVKDAIQLARYRERTYPRFAEVPVKPKTLVFRVERIGKKHFVWECAMTKSKVVKGGSPVLLRPLDSRRQVRLLPVKKINDPNSTQSIQFSVSASRSLHRMVARGRFQIDCRCITST